MTREEVWHYPDFVRDFHTSTPLRSETKLRKSEESWLGKKCDIILTLSDFSTLLHIWEVWSWEVWNLGWERKVGLFHTSTPLRSIELRLKKESRDLVASAGHLSLTLHRLQRSTFLSTNYLKRSKLPILCLQNGPLFCDSWTVVDIVRK